MKKLIAKIYLVVVMSVFLGCILMAPVIAGVTYMQALAGWSVFLSVIVIVVFAIKALYWSIEVIRDEQ